MSEKNTWAKCQSIHIFCPCGINLKLWKYKFYLIGNHMIFGGIVIWNKKQQYIFQRLTKFVSAYLLVSWKLRPKKTQTLDSSGLSKTQTQTQTETLTKHNTIVNKYNIIVRSILAITGGYWQCDQTIGRDLAPLMYKLFHRLVEIKIKLSMYFIVLL